MAEESTSPQPVEEKAYGGKGKTLKWVLIYAVAAIVIYGIIYYVMAARNNAVYDSKGTGTDVYSNEADVTP